MTLVTRRRLEVVLCAVPISLFALAAWAHRNIIDDGFIYLRVIHQVTGGHGPVFNVGERVEAFTSPLWVAVLSTADFALPFRLEWIAVGIGMTATLIGLVLAALGSARLMRSIAPDTMVVPFGLVALVVLAPMWFYASSGLETGVAFLWIGACTWILATWSQTNEAVSWPRIVVLGLGWLVRPEMILYTFAFTGVVLFAGRRDDGWRYRVRVLLIAFALPAGYQLFRMGYYGSLVANTALAKEGTSLRWQRGWRYLADYADTYVIVVPAVILLIGGYLPVLRDRTGLRRGRETAVVAAIGVAALANFAYVVAVGGDYEHARLLLPATFAFCAPIAVVPLAKRFVVALALGPWAIAGIVFLRPTRSPLGAGFAVPVPGQVTTEQANFGPTSRAQLASDRVVAQTAKFSVFTPLDVPIAP